MIISSATGSSSASYLLDIQLRVNIQCKIAVFSYMVYFMYLRKTITYYSFTNFPHGNHSQLLLVARVVEGWTETLLQSADLLAVQKQKTKTQPLSETQPDCNWVKSCM